MIIDRGGRASGKTTRAAMWAAGDPADRVVVVHNLAAVDHVRGIGNRMGLDLQVITFAEYLSGGVRGRNVETYIDEVALCLSTRGGKVAGMSL